VLRRIVRFVVAVPAVVVLVALGVANIHDVRLALDPFRPDDPALSIVLPFYVWLLTALTIGVVVGGLATWMTQATWRRSARRQDAEAQRWHAEADRLHRERELEASPQALPAGRQGQVSGVRLQGSG
jgi:MFS superfamily sulfate permease-like transporter